MPWIPLVLTIYIYDENDGENKKKEEVQAIHYSCSSMVDYISHLNMASWDDIMLVQIVDLIKENERTSSYRELREKFHVSSGSIWNIFKRKREYVNDYECNHNKNN